MVEGVGGGSSTAIHNNHPVFSFPVEQICVCIQAPHRAESLTATVRLVCTENKHRGIDRLLAQEQAFKH